MPYEKEEDEFEIMPHHEIEEMKKEIKELKKGSVDKTIQSSIDILNGNIKDLLAIFREATKEIREEEEKVEETQKSIKEIGSNVDDLFDQNAKIAEAMIAIHDTVGEMKKKIDKIAEKREEPAAPSPRMPPLPEYGRPPEVSPRAAPPQPRMPPPAPAHGFEEHRMAPLPITPPPRRSMPPPPGMSPQPKKKRKGLFV